MISGSSKQIQRVNYFGQKTLGGVKEDVPFDIALSADGGYVIAGEPGSIDGDVTNNHSQTDFWIVKLNTAGSLVWQHTYGGIREDAPHSIIASADGWIFSSR